MYLEFYNFSKAPFGADSDPNMVFPGAQYRYSLATLIHGVKQGMGMLALTGEHGCGKSTLFRSLKNSLEEEQQTLLIIDDHNVDISDVIESIAALLDRGRTGMGLNDLVDRIRSRLVELSEEGRKLVVLVENAEHLSDEVLTGLGTLSGIGTPQYKLLQVVLFGDETLKLRLNTGALEILQDRIRLHLELKRLSEAETSAYINYRISASGGEIDLFTSGAVSVLFEASRGNPGKIDLLCDRALLIGYKSGQHIIDAEVVRDIQIEQPENNSEKDIFVRSHSKDTDESNVQEEHAERVLELSTGRDREVESLSEPYAHVNPMDNALPGRRRGAGGRFGVTVAIVVGGVFLGVLGYLVSDLTTSSLSGSVAVPKVVAEKNVVSPDAAQSSDAAKGYSAQSEEIETREPVIYQLLSADDSSDRPGGDKSRAEIESSGDNSGIPVLAAAEGVKPKVRPLEIIEAAVVKSDRESLKAETGRKPETVLKPVKANDLVPFPFDEQVAGEWQKLSDKQSLSQLARRQFGSWNDSIKDILKQTNPHLKSFDSIAAGTDIWIPNISRNRLVVHLEGIGYYFYFRSTTGPITARKNRAYLQEKGFDAMVKIIKSPSKALHRVYGGPFETSEQAEKAMESVKFTFAPSVLK